MTAEDTYKVLMDITGFVRCGILIALLAALWKRIISEDIRTRRMILFLILFFYLNFSDHLSIPTVIKYPMVIGFVAVYCYVLKLCEWERPVFLLLFVYNLHTVSYLIADSIYLETADMLIDRVDMDQPDAIERIYLSSYFSMALLLIAEAVLIFVLYRIFIRLSIDLSGLRLWEFMFLSALNVFGIVFSYTMLKLSIIQMDTSTFILYDDAPDMIWKIPLLSSLLLVGEYSSLYVFSRYKKYLGEREYLYMREQDLRSLRDRVEESQVLYGSMQTLRHDINNHIQTIRGLIDAGEQARAKEYFDRITELTDGMDMRYSTGNALCDVVLNDKSRLADRYGINMEVSFIYPEGISDFDMGIILSNMLDNAIEACEKLGSKDRIIDVSLRTEGPCVLLTVANPYDGDVIFDKESGLPVSTKPDGVHGLGLANVAMIAEDHLGRIMINAEGGVFSVSVMLQLSSDS